MISSPVEAISIDQSVKNKWKASWLAEEVTVTVNKKERRQRIGDSIVKISLPGQAVCTLCGNRVVNYGKGGKMYLSATSKAKNTDSF